LQTIRELKIQNYYETRINHLKKCNKDLRKRLKEKDNIINELEKWLEEQIKISQAHNNQLGVNVCNTFKNKLNELKGDSSNE
jgi:predicted RNase H-like nuclease (RuvC/YqgF family)